MLKFYAKVFRTSLLFYLIDKRKFRRAILYGDRSCYYFYYFQEQQTPLHIAARLGNVDNVVLLLQHGASPNAVTKDQYTPLHIAAKEGHEEVASVLLEHDANLNLTTKVWIISLNSQNMRGAIY